MVALLLAHGATPDHINRRGDTPLLVAFESCQGSKIERDKLDVLFDLLVAHGANINSASTGEKILEQVLRSNREDDDDVLRLVGKLVQLKLEVDKMRIHPITLALLRVRSEATQIELVKLVAHLRPFEQLMGGGMKLWGLLTENFSHVGPRVLEFLIDHFHIDLQATIEEPRFPCRRKPRQGTLLHAMCRTSHVSVCVVEKMRMLLERGADATALDDKGAQPLHHLRFACPSDIEVAKLLVEHGASLNALTRKGSTVLHRMMRALGVSAHSWVHRMINNSKGTVLADVEKNLDELFMMGLCASVRRQNWIGRQETASEVLEVLIANANGTSTCTERAIIEMLKKQEMIEQEDKQEEQENRKIEDREPFKGKDSQSD